MNRNDVKESQNSTVVEIILIPMLMVTHTGGEAMTKLPSIAAIPYDPITIRLRSTDDSDVRILSEEEKQSFAK